MLRNFTVGSDAEMDYAFVLKGFGCGKVVEIMIGWDGMGWDGICFWFI